MKTAQIGHWSVTIGTNHFAPVLYCDQVLKNEVPEEKARIYISTELLSKLRLKNEDFWKFSLRSKRFRASSWRMLGWEQKREMNWTFISFALTPTFVRLVERKRLLRRLCPNNIHQQRSVIFTQRLCHGHADDLFPFFFSIYRNGYVTASHAGVSRGRRFSSLPGMTEHVPPTPRPSETLLFHFVAVKKAGYLYTLIFKSSMLVF